MINLLQKIQVIDKFTTQKMQVIDKFTLEEASFR